MVNYFTTCSKFSHIYTIVSNPTSTAKYRKITTINNTIITAINLFILTFMLIHIQNLS